MQHLSRATAPTAAAAVTTVPPPLPAEARPKEPIRLAHPVQAPATVAVPRGARRDATFRPADSDDQYDIPAFLRKGQQPRE